MGWRTTAYGPRIISSWPPLKVTTPLQFRPSVNLAQIQKAKPAMHKTTPIPRKRINMRDHAKIERIGEPLAFENQITADQNRDHITQLLPSAFLIDRSFGPERRK